MANDAAFDSQLSRLEEQLSLVTPRSKTVAEACDAMRETVADADRDAVAAAAVRLGAALRSGRGEAAGLVFDLLADLLTVAPSPEAVAADLLAAREPALRGRAVDCICERWQDGDAPPPPLAAVLAAAAGAMVDEAPDAQPDLLERVTDLLAAGAPVASLLDHAHADPVRRLAARRLDAAGEPVPADRLEGLLGAEGAATLTELVQYTRAGHADLVDLTPDGPLSAARIAGFTAAFEALGSTALGAVIGELGWAAASSGLWVERRVGLSVDGSYPLLVTPSEAELLAGCGNERVLWDRCLVVAHGGQAGAAPDAGGETEEVGRFRRYNLLHAELLGEILEIAPVTPHKVNRILTSLDEVVDLFAGLFKGLTDEADRVHHRYAALREPVVARLEGVPDDEPLDAELTRLVQMFEDPRDLDAVTTLHGLKRYLHQLGLRLAFQRFRSGRAANRTVDLAVVAAGRVTSTLRKIRYIDFEPDTEAGGIPFFPALAVEALGRRLLHGLTEAPDLEIMIYGNEVQTFVNFRNHPAFLRIDVSPPLRGGMIDLEYYGVSQYELEHHPDIALPWIQRIFRRLEFDASADGVRLHIRYDKERAFDFDDLIRGVRVMCSLLPHLMDLDWVLGGLRYPEPVRQQVADHWADWIVRWGVLPLTEMLTSDRRAILRNVRSGPTGKSEIPWNGQGAVQHRLSGAPLPSLWDRLREALSDRDPQPAVRWAAATEASPAQRTLQDFVLDPVRECAGASAAGDMTDPPLRFATLLAAGGEVLARAARTANVVDTVERHLRFATVGSVQGFPVQRATLLLPGEVLEISVLRSGCGGISLAQVRARPFLLTPGPPLSPPADDRDPGWIDAAALAARLRRGNYVGVTCTVPPAVGEADLPDLVADYAAENPHAEPAPHPADRTLSGIVAAPGRVTGVAVFYRDDLTSTEVDGAVLFAPTLRPEDTPLLRRAAAVVSTGGGILSHAGMIAQELGKPALVLEGTWHQGEAGRPSLTCRTVDYTPESRASGPYRVTLRRNWREREEQLEEGDLVVVDADHCRLGVLGQDRDALALQEELRHHDLIAVELDHVEPGPQELALRGRLLRATHQLQKLLTRIKQPNLARHAARELLTSRHYDAVSERSQRTALLRRLFENEHCGEIAREAAIGEKAGLERRLHGLCENALSAVAAAVTAHEVVFLQRSVQRVEAYLTDVRRSLAAVGILDGDEPSPGCGDLPVRVRRRLAELQQTCAAAVDADADDPEQWWRARSSLESLAVLDAVTGSSAPAAQAGMRDRLRSSALLHEQRAVAQLVGRPVITCDEGGLELAQLIGAKGAGLGEIGRILGPELVPSWFAVSDAAFREALATGIGRVDQSLGLVAGTPLTLAIRAVMARTDLDTAAQAAAIRAAWNSVELPEELAAGIVAAYHDLAGEGDKPDRHFVAVRSSSFEEDSARSSWAGQFDTFLCIRGGEAVVEHVKLAWASLWSERVLLHRRALAGGDALPEPGGGVLIQRLVESRAAGVVHTLSAATGQPREMVLNVGLGLGEGVVSGTVEVDQVVVSRTADPEPGDLRFRYTVGDKRTQVVYDRRVGCGTCIAETLYHQRLRPALEYTDLQDVVRAACALEVAHGYPLDVEFALEGDRLFVLQARPIVAFQEALQQARTPSSRTGT